MNYFGIVNMAFNVREEIEGYGHLGVMGFGRAGTGLMLYTGIFMSFAMSQLTQNRLLKIVAYCSAPLLVLSLLFTWSRAIQLAMMVSAISLAFTLGGIRAIKGVMVTIIGAIIICIAVSHFPDVRERLAFFFGEESSIMASAGRLQGWADLIKWLLKSPGVLLFGVGFQNFHYFVHLHAAAVRLEAAHNNFLNILTEFGIAGFLLFIGWLFSIFLWLVSWRREMVDKVDRMIPGIFISFMLGMVVSCLTQESLAPALGMMMVLMYFLIILGIWVSYYRTQIAEFGAIEELEYTDYAMIQQQ